MAKHSESGGRRVGVLMGGLSAERDVSLDTGRGVYDALISRGHDCVAIDWTEGSSLPALLADAKVDVVWNALHGTYGEDGAVQGLMQCLGISYTGSGILASSLAMDKVASKRIFESHEIGTPAWRLADDDETSAQVLARMPAPLVVKPANEGSSVGVTVVTDPAQLDDALALARRCHGPTLVETFIAGTEIQTGILDDQVLGSIDVRPAAGFYDYDAKYCRDDTQYLTPTLPDAILAKAEQAALDAHRALMCGSYSRVDMRVSDDGVAYVLEVNTLPGMTSHSLLPKIAANKGIDYASLCEKILFSANHEERHDKARD